ncbi:uncharacterized protein TNCV_187701 [Trichonephila clavipes]|nr:uncharacterized protein TNCV_187701 [Trichonephila clavipes]
MYEFFRRSSFAPIHKELGIFAQTVADWPNCASDVLMDHIVVYTEKLVEGGGPTENSLAVLNHKILEANSQVQNVKLGGHQTCLSINRLRHELCDMLRRLVGTTAPGHNDCSIQE